MAASYCEVAIPDFIRQRSLRVAQGFCAAGLLRGIFRAIVICAKGRSVPSAVPKVAGFPARTN